MRNQLTKTKERLENPVYPNGKSQICTVFGCGQIFFKHYLNWLVPSFEKFIFCDPLLESRDKLSDIQKSFAGKNYTKEIDIKLDSQKVTVGQGNSVFIFMNHKSHYQLIKQSLQASLVFVEKPCLLNSDSWESLQTKLQESRSSFWPAYHHYYTDLPERINTLNQKLDIKDIDEIDICFYASNLPIRQWGGSYTTKKLSRRGSVLRFRTSCVFFAINYGS